MDDGFGLLGRFTEKYAIESFPDGDGVLVDLTNGSYFKLNASAVRVCEALRRCEAVDRAIGYLSQSMVVPLAEATEMVTLVKAGLSRGVVAQEAPGPLRYVSCPDGSAIFEESGRPIFYIAPGSRSVRLRAKPSELASPLVLYLQALVPKLLALLDIPVLHAAACRVAGSVLAFSGSSGAGKTTTARAFERAGADLLSEDLVIVTFVGDSPLMYTNGERFARGWARSVAPQLERIPDEEIDFGALSGAQQGLAIPLSAMWFVDVRRRAGTELKLRRLSPSDGTLALLANGLLATSNARHWRDFLRRSRLIGDRTSLSEATMPDGLSPLENAVARYIVNSAS